MKVNILLNKQQVKEKNKNGRLLTFLTPMDIEI